MRESIATYENGVLTTYPFDAGIARELYVALFQPADARMSQISHLIFEPDGAMLQLPANLLVMQQNGVDAYQARTKVGGDEFDFRGIAWLGRDHAVSTAVSARSFADARHAALSAAPREYIGFGQNAPAGVMRQASLVRSTSGEGSLGCDWPLAEWSRPSPPPNCGRQHN